MSTDALPVLTTQDFTSDQDVRWCPGCGDYSILAQMKKVLPTLGIPPEKTVFISGIGCSSRFPYYMNTYGIHSIHGRAPAVATGLEVQPARFVGVGDYRRRRRAFDRRQPLDACHPPQSRSEHRAVQQPHLRPDEGTILAHFAVGQNDQKHAQSDRSTTRFTRFRWPLVAKRPLSPARSTCTSST